MKCKCKEDEGSTTIACCNKCGLPLKTEPWEFQIKTTLNLLISKEEEMRLRRSRLPKRTKKERDAIVVAIRKDTEEVRAAIRELAKQ